MLRKACVSGQFYPGSPEVLKKTVEGFLTSAKKEKAICVISPHAGYIYSGKVAGSVLASVTIPSTVVLIGPNHTGLGENASIMTQGEWETPLGRVRINEELSNLIANSPSHRFSVDTLAHLGEHSLEVQLPFLCLQNPAVTIVPITVMPARFSECEEMGKDIANAISSYKNEVLMVVSSDMNHYESESVTKEKDQLAIDKVLSLDARGLIEVTQERGITMCGVVPATIAIVAARILGAKEAKLVSYSTSGESSGDFSHVVGYAGIVIK